MTYMLGDFQIAPNFLWQRPIEGPVAGDMGGPARPRNIIDDPFVVREGNRETVAGELLITYDPTPGTWMYQWDNDFAEDAEFALSAGFIFRHQPTIMDGPIGIDGDGRSIIRFDRSVPAQDLWEVYTRIVSKPSKNLGVVANIYGGTAQARGSDARLVERVGGDIRMIYKNVKVMGMAKVNDWGPFDYHRDFNLTFPLQLAADISISEGAQSWFNLPGTQLGIRYTWRSLDNNSPRYCPTRVLDGGEYVCDEKAIGFPNGNEWEIRTYITFFIGK
jgi:hypothetical protein